MTDQELYQGILQNNQETMRHIYAQFYPRIARHVSNNGGQEEDALDVFQDSVVILWLNIKEGKYEVREGARLSTYLQSISKNIWSSKKRATEKRKLVISIVSEQQEVVEEDEEIIPTKIQLLEASLNTLGEKCQHLLRLFYYEKTSLRDIAHRLSLTEKTAKNNKYRCMQQLRANLK